MNSNLKFYYFLRIKVKSAELQLGQGTWEFMAENSCNTSQNVGGGQNVFSKFRGGQLCCFSDFIFNEINKINIFPNIKGNKKSIKNASSPVSPIGIIG